MKSKDISKKKIPHETCFCGGFFVSLLHQLTIKTVQTMKVNYNGRELEVIVTKQPFAEYVDFYDVDGELYAYLGTNFSDNLLLGAIWVQVGGIQEELAAIIPNILKKTDRVHQVKNGHFTTRYNMYEII